MRKINRIFFRSPNKAYNGREIRCLIGVTHTRIAWKGDGSKDQQNTSNNTKWNHHKLGNRDSILQPNRSKMTME